jgi:hypothetical protein
VATTIINFKDGVKMGRSSIHVHGKNKSISGLISIT